MQKTNMEADLRTELRKGATNRLRKAGKIPAIIYGHNNPIAIQLEANEFYKSFRNISENTIINLTVDGNSYDVLVKAYQEDLLANSILHVDFYEIEQGRSLRTHIPVHITGSSVGAREGGILENPLHDIEVECLPTDMPESFDIDISELQIGDAVHVGDLEVPEGVRILNTMEQVIVAVTHVREEVEEEEELEEGLEEGMEEEALEAEEEEEQEAEE